VIAVVENVERVLAVGRVDDAFEDEVALAAVEALQLAGREVVAVGKDQAVVLGQQRAGLADRIHAHGGLLLFVEDEIARGGFLVGTHLQHDHVRARRGVGDVGIVDLLVSVVDGLGVDAFAGGGVVLDLEREVAADAVDEDAVLDRDVRVTAVTERLARRRLPAELELRRETFAAKLGFGAAVEVAQLAAVEGPLEDGDVVHAGADLEHDVEVAADEGKLAERGLRRRRDRGV
jgi:hypothetical protein